MTRAILADIRASASALSGSSRGVLHLSLPVSLLHIAAKLRISAREVLERCRESVAFASGLAAAVEMGAEDATRADRNFLLDYCGTAVDSGARIVNIADTVGRSVPGEFASLLAFLREGIPAFRDGRAILSVHCHNDFGLANANTLAGIGAGCAQIEVTALGIGERSGNASLEEIAAILAARTDFFGPCPDLDYPSLGRLARLLSGILGTGLSPFKPVTGANTRSHASGIHQQALAVDPATYNSRETDPFCLVPDRIVIGRHSGKAGLRAAIARYAGIPIDGKTLACLLSAVKEACRESPQFGITELLALLNSEGLIAVDPLRCLSLATACTHSAPDNRLQAEFAAVPATTPSACLPSFEVNAVFSASSASPASSMTVIATAPTWKRALEQAVETLFPPGICVETLSFSGFASAREATGESPAAAPPAQRLYLEASAAAAPYRRYAIERTGIDRDRLYLECLLDIVNAENCLTRNP